MTAFAQRVQDLDDHVEDWWDRWRGQLIADRLFYGASNLGDFSLIWHLVSAVRALHPRHQAVEAVRVSIIIGLESLVVNQGIKRLFGRTRPGSAAQNSSQHQLRQPVTSSFPSGHASAAFTAATVMGRQSPLAPLYFALAAVVAGSRIHVRLHHASDVAGGVAVGLGLGWAANRFSALSGQRHKT